MERRHFIALVCGAAALPLGVLAQQSERARRVGVLIGYAEDDVETQARLAEFRRDLAQLGWQEGRNLQLELRFAPADLRKAELFAKELAAMRPEVLVGNSTPATAALLHATSTIPIVFVGVSDPVGSGFVQSISRPGGNTTGFTNFEPSLTGKWLEILKEIAPKTVRAAVIFNPETAPGGGAFFLERFEQLARSISVEPIAAPAHDPAGIEDALRSLAHEPGGGFIVMPDAFTTVHRKLIIELAVRYRLPAIYPYRYHSLEGGLVSYGVDTVDLFRQAAGYVTRILNGEKPSELAVQAPVKFQLVINLKTAKSLGLTVPPPLMALAEEVIE